MGLLRRRRPYRNLRANLAATAAATVLALAGLAMAYRPANPVAVRAGGAVLLAGMAAVAVRSARSGVVVTETGLVVRGIVETSTVPWGDVRQVIARPSGDLTGLGRCLAIRTAGGQEVVARQVASYSPERLERLVAELQAAVRDRQRGTEQARMARMPDWRRLGDDLTASLHPAAPPIAITFSPQPPAGVPAYDAPLPPPTPDGRTGRVPAGCVFWMKATDATFTTEPADHGNCSVGSLTHGLLTLEEAAGRADVGALVESGWVDPAAFSGLPVVRERPGAITYGPLAETPVDPDVVLVRLTGRSLMVLSDALPGLRIEGKPQCHIVAAAKEQGEVVASVGCALSRARTGMRSTEVTAAIPAGRLGEVVNALQEAARADATVAAYATEDARRFG